jgi:hypothetical protein
MKERREVRSWDTKMKEVRWQYEIKRAVSTDWLNEGKCNGRMNGGKYHGRTGDERDV